VFIKSDFIGLDGIHHLAAGGETPMLKSHLAAAAEFMHDKALGMPGRERFFAKRQRACQLLADMLNVTAQDISLLGSSSAGIVQVVCALDWHPGNEVVVVDDEYPSGRYAFTWLERFAVTVKMPAYHPDADVELANICAHLTPNTKLVYVSHVSTRTGRRIDIHAIAAAAHAVGAKVLVDATHSLGIVPVDAAHIDFLVCSGYKWLLGTHLGILLWNRRLVPEFGPPPGWRSAMPGETPDTYVLHADAARAEVGNPNFLDVYVLVNALEYLRRYSVVALEEHALQYGGHILEAFAAAGCAVLTPVQTRQRAGNICIATEHAAEIVVAARAQQVHIWGDHDLRRIRLSVHGYVTADDCDAAVRVVPALVRQYRS